MGRVFTFVMFFTMLTIVLELMGMGSIVGSSLLTLIGFNGESTLDTGYNLTNSPFWIAVIALLSLTTVGGIVVSFYARNQLENYIVLPFIVGTTILFVDVIVGILQKMGEWEPWIAMPIAVVYIGLGVGFGITMVEFFRGNT